MIPNWLWHLPINMISREATNCGLSRNLVCAMIMTETAGNDYSARYEKSWRYLYKTDYFAKKNRISLSTEVVLQSTSWGHLQIMGSVARELGYDGALPRLAQPLMGIKWGCIKIKQVSGRYSNIDDIISSYNQGSPRKVENGYRYINQHYVDKVNRYLSELE